MHIATLAILPFIAMCAAQGDQGSNFFGHPGTKHDDNPDPCIIDFDHCNTNARVCRWNCGSARVPGRCAP